MTPNNISVLEKYFELTDIQKEQFAKLGDLYAKWNEQINVVSRKDIENLYEKHILHSLALARLVVFAPQTKILDLGTGGGFPGIPLAIFFPEVSFHLVDSIAKKLKVVEAIAQELGLKNVTTSHERVEKLKTKYDFVVTRGVSTLAELVNWTKNKFKSENLHNIKNGLFAYKGGDLVQEMEDAYKKIKIFELSEFFEEEFFQTKKILYIAMV